MHAHFLLTTALLSSKLLQNLTLLEIFKKFLCFKTLSGLIGTLTYKIFKVVWVFKTALANSGLLVRN